MNVRMGLSLAWVAVLAGSAVADVRLPKIFTDNMMVQRDQPIRVWGWAEAGEAVSVSMNGANAAATADAKGQWLVELPVLKQGEKLELTVKGKNAIVLKNVIVGDVWLCSGQSNMELALGGCQGAPEDCKAADLPSIRRMKFNHVQAGYPEADAPAATPWQVCTPQTAGSFSAAAFYFAREVQAKTGVPIGILDDNWGGTRIEPWVAPAGMAAVPELHDAVNERSNAVVAYRAQLPKSLDELERWIAVARIAMTNGSASIPAAPAMPDFNNSWCGMFNAMVSPLTRFPIKGALWYQGESNGSEGESYYHKMQALVGGWRQAWNLGNFPFYFVQLASYQNASDNPAGGDGWAKLREAQNRALSIPNSGMAVIVDTVPLKDAGNIHPVDKYDAGMRLARWALNRDYGQKDLIASGPLYKELKVEGGKVRLSFDYVGGGLMAGSKTGRTPVVEDQSGKLKRFAVAGADKKWCWADAVIDGQTVVVSSPDVKEPVAVRYAFSQNPDGANLYNREGLPATPFRTDNW
jgi:sialate O-acetylesterase